jgi:hypothetical protein
MIDSLSPANISVTLAVECEKKGLGAVPNRIQKPKMHQVLIAVFKIRPNRLEFGDDGSAEPKTLDNPKEEWMRNKSDPERDKGGCAPNGIEQIANVPCHQQ